MPYCQLCNKIESASSGVKRNRNEKVKIPGSPLVFLGHFRCFLQGSPLVFREFTK